MALQPNWCCIATVIASSWMLSLFHLMHQAARKICIPYMHLVSVVTVFTVIRDGRRGEGLLWFLLVHLTPNWPRNHSGWTHGCAGASGWPILGRGTFLPDSPLPPALLMGMKNGTHLTGTGIFMCQRFLWHGIGVVQGEDTQRVEL